MQPPQNKPYLNLSDEKLLIFPCTVVVSRSIKLANDPNHTVKVVTKGLQDKQSQCFGRAVTKPPPQRHSKVMRRAGKVCARLSI